MSVHTSGSISMADGREELNKMSKVSRSYPTPGIEEVDVDTFSGSDYFYSVRTTSYNPNGNNVGRNMDGSWSLNKLYGYDTWNPPTIIYKHLIQFTKTGDLRILFRTNGGDPIRTAYALYLTSTKPSSWSSVSTLTPDAIIRFAPEWSNPNPYDYINCYFEPDYFCRVLGTNSSDNHIHPLDIGWGTHLTSDDVDTSYKRSPTSYHITDQDQEFSFSIRVDANGTSSGNKIYASLVMIDGREYHTLGETTNSTYSTYYNSTDISTYDRQVFFNLDSLYGIGDAKSSDGGITLFSEYGSWGASNILDDSAVLSPANIYYFFEQYLNGTGDFFWCYYTSGSSAIPEYNTNTEDEHTAGPDKWFYITGIPFQLNGLSSNTTYRVWVMPVGPSDTSSGPSSMPGASEDISFTTQNYTPPPAWQYDPSEVNNLQPIGASFRTDSFGTTVNISWDDTATPPSNVGIYARGYVGSTLYEASKTVTWGGGFDSVAISGVQCDVVTAYIATINTGTNYYGDGVSAPEF